MLRAKLTVIFVFAVITIAACGSSEPARFSIAAGTGYETSLFRQNCAICHGPEGDGKTLDDGTVVPSLRAGEFKKKTEADIYNQISEGGNGMTPFRTQLTEREMRLLTDLVHNKLRQ
ncbi:MAG TPA: cytochrome c [Pyrinomonadaceae bacterium]|nr:cytochrome c [Pyrinomonadaceae bacterium]